MSKKQTADYNGARTVYTYGEGNFSYPMLMGFYFIGVRLKFAKDFFHSPKLKLSSINLSIDRLKMKIQNFY